MARDIRVELHITGLAILDLDTRLIHFIDTSSKKCPEHQHFPRITFRPDDYAGARYPIEDSADLLRPSPTADFQTSFALGGAVTVGTKADIDSGDTTLPAIDEDPPEGLYPLSEIVSREQLGFDRFVSGYQSTTTTATIRLIGGDLHAAKRIIDKDGDEQEFETRNGRKQYFCEHIVWTRVVNPRLRVHDDNNEFKLGRTGCLRFALTNLPNYGWLGVGELNRKYFNHLEMLGDLGVAEGTYQAPKPIGGGLSGGSESCSPSKGP